MSQLHVDYCVKQLSIGVDPEWGKITVGDFDIPEAEVMSIRDCWVFVDEAEYCPMSDIPDWWPRGCGVFVQGDEMLIVGDNGMCAFHFKLTRQA